jgi:hypothetical protein
MRRNGPAVQFPPFPSDRPLVAVALGLTAFVLLGGLFVREFGRRRPALDGDGLNEG